MFCDNLKRIRKKAGRTQKDIADHLSISAQSISKWENGESLPSVEYLPLLAAFLGCSVNAFFDEEELSRFEDGYAPLRYEKNKDIKDKINDAFKHFSIDAEVVDVFDGVRVQTYKILMHRDVGINNILKKADDIRFYIGVHNARFITDGYEGSYFGIEIAKVDFERLEFSDEEIKNILIPLNYSLPILLGKDVDNSLVSDDLARMAHLAVTGESGTGKTTFLWSVIRGLTASLTPEELKLVVLDLKKCEFTALENNAFLFDGVARDPDSAVVTLKKVVGEMNRRKELLNEAGVYNIQRYADATGKRFEKIVILVDELADLVIMDSEAEELLIEIAMWGRTVGIHLIVATGYSSEELLSSLVLCNIPSRLSFRLSDKEDSLRVIDTSDATMLDDRGDMLYMPATASKPVRIQGIYTSY